MKRLAFLISGGVLVAFAGTAYAFAQLTSPPLPTSVNTSGACYVRNSGNKTIPVSVSLFSNNGLIVNFDNCNTGPLGPGKTCVILVNDLPDDSFASCSATAEAVGKLRGTLEIRENTPVLRVLVSEDLK